MLLSLWGRDGLYDEAIYSYLAQMDARDGLADALVLSMRACLGGKQTLDAFHSETPK